MPRTGQEIAGYRIDGMIGAGGMGVVYEATQVALDRPVALKLLTPGLGASEDFRTRFRREAMLQAALEHPNVVSVYEAGECEEGLFIAMRLVRGTNLKALIEGGELAPARAVDLLEQAASALDAAHEAGLVHRDVKPQNILVDADDHAFLADFGLTKGVGDRGVTLSSQYAGSLDYAAPEQIRGEPYGPSGDLYAFGIVVYEALTGTIPFPYDTEAALLYAHLSEEPPSATSRRPGLPVGVDEVVARALAKRPEDRHASAAELVAETRRALASEPLATPGERRRFSETIVESRDVHPAPAIAIEERRRVPWRAVALGVVALLALALGAAAIGRVTAPAHDPRRGVATAGPVSLTFRADRWAPAAAPAIPGLGLTGAVALRSTQDDAPGTVVAGIAPDAQGPGLLPPALVSQLTANAPSHVVTLGSLRGLDYPSLPAARVPSQLSLLLVPTARGAVAVACLWPKVMTPGTEQPGCDTVAATLRLNGLRAVPLGSTSAYSARLAAALTLLDGERLAARRQLAGAMHPLEQARAASVLRAAFGQAVTAVAGVQPTPTQRPAQDALAASLRRAETAYARLARAARAQNTAAYARAAKAADVAERDVDAAIGRLSST